MFFYYEILLPLEQKENIFNEKERYYLINPKWIDQYKKYYNYEKIRTLLNNINNDNINYYNSDDFTNKLIKTVKDEINFNKLKLPEDLLNKDKIEPPIIIKEKIKYYKLSYIIPSKIMDNIEKNEFNDKDIYLESVEIFVKENNIYISGFYNIMIDSLNDKLLYVPKYIFSYKTMDILDLENEKLKSYSIEEYITMNNCINNNYNNIQKIGKKGELLILGENLDEILYENNAEESENNEFKTKYKKRHFAKSFRYREDIKKEINFEYDFNYKINIYKKREGVPNIIYNSLNLLKSNSLEIRKEKININISQRIKKFKNINNFNDKKENNNSIKLNKEDEELKKHIKNMENENIMKDNIIKKNEEEIKGLQNKILEYKKELENEIIKKELLIGENNKLKEDNKILKLKKLEEEETNKKKII